MEKIHHSLEDWEFEPGSNFFITDRQKISSPTSLGLDPLGEWGVTGECYLGDALGHSIPNGRFITNHRFEYAGRSELGLYFRQDERVWGTAPQNCYFSAFDIDNYALWKRVEGGWTELLVGPLTEELVENKWYKARWTFYEFFNASLVNVFRTILEIDRGAGYVEEFSFDDEDNPLSGQEVNRLSFRLDAGNYTKWSYADDTEVWRKI